MTQPTRAYVRPLRRIAARTRTQDGAWALAILLSTLAPEDVLSLTGQPLTRVDDPTAVLRAYVTFYDQRGGGIETAFREDKQGLGLTKRTKKRFAAQAMVVGLGTLAHNVLVWAREWLGPAVPTLGLRRLVRDVLHISGFVAVDATTGRLLRCMYRPNSLSSTNAVGMHRQKATEQQTRTRPWPWRYLPRTLPSPWYPHLG